MKSVNLPRAVAAARKALARAEAAGTIDAAEATARRADLDRMTPPDLTRRRVAFAGVFAFGTQADCARATHAAGGIPERLTARTDLLVTGSLSPPRPATIDRARATGAEVIDETDWRAALHETRD